MSTRGTKRNGAGRGKDAQHRPLLRLVSAAAAAMLLAGTTTNASAANADKAQAVDPFFGSFGTSVPIQVPGYHGLAPKIELAYNSQGRDSQIGVGWHLPGSPTIERASAGKGAPRYDGADIFVLDGMELVPCTTMGGTHCSKIQSYQRITWDAPNNTWHLWQKDGIRLDFAPVYTTGKGVFRWGVSSATDPRGNTVSYGYWCESGADCYPDSISYNGTTIKMYREPRSDVTSFANGAGFGKTSYRLKSIDVTTNGVRVRAYKLAYKTSPSSSRSLLLSVQTFGSDATVDSTGTVTGGTSAPETAFSYQGTAAALPYGSSSSTGETYWTSVVDSPTYHGKALPLDINGDGKSDLVMIYQDVNNRTTLAQHWISNGTGLVFAGSSSTNSETYWTSVVDSPTYKGRVFTMDVNGDGKGDVVMVYQDVNNRTTLVQHWISDGSKLQYAGSSSTGETYWSSVVDSPTYHGKAFATDLNGDGKGDLVMVYQDVNNRTTLAQHWISDGSKLQFAGSSSTGETYWTSVVDSPTYHGKVLPMDVNGDGKGDLVMIYQDVNNRTTLAQHWLSDGSKLVYSGGASTTTETYWTSVVDSGTYRGQVLPMDLNGDGKGDLTLVYQDINNRVTLEQHWLSDGTKLVYAGSSSRSAETYWTSVVESPTYHGKVFAMDLTGDGKTDMAMIYQDVNNRTTLAQHWIASGGNADLLSSVSNGLGGTTAVTYAPSSSWSNTYMPQGMSFPTVASVTNSDGRGASSTTNYTYSGGLWSDSERRFLGFRKVTAVLDAAGNYTETYYHQHVGCISKPEVTYYRNAAGDIYRYSTYGYTENSSAPYTSLMTDRWEYECNLTGSCRRTLLQIAYDQYGNGYKTYEWGDYDVAGDERTSLRGVYPNTQSYIVGVPAYENMYAGIGTGGQLLKQMLFEYDGNGTYDAAPSKGLMTRKKAWDSQTGGYIAQSFGYDAKGNIVSETDASGATTTTQWDASGHRIRTCNALGDCSTTVWEPGLDLIKSETDINGGVTNYTHDALGRPVHTILPDGTTETMAYLDWGNASLQRIRKTVWDGSSDGLWTEAYEDGLGRPYKMVKEGGLVQETLYSDASKRVWKKSGWYGPGETPKYQVFAFDGLGRVRSVTNADGTSGQTYYGNDYAVTYDELGHEKVTWTDAYGQTSAVREKNGASYQHTYYQHDLLGNLTGVTDAAGNVTSITWDSLGRKVMGCDPDTGCNSYTYNEAGQILTHRNAKGQVADVSYDALGRPLVRTSGDGSQVFWAYDQAGHGASKGKWTSVTDSSGTESRNYDSAGRVTSSTKCVGSDCATTSSTYDAAGRLASTTYPDGEVVTYTYDALGRLASVPGYVTSIQYNARGQMLSIDYANGTRNTYTYSDQRNWLTSTSVTGSGGTLFQMAYGYDAAARVTSTTSSTNPMAAMSYGYDDLSRLTSVSGGQSQSLSYDALGNIINNSSVGAYGYGDAGHRHAVTAAGSDGYSYDANGNMTLGAGRTMSWNADNQLLSVTKNGTTTTNVYDYAGERVKRTTASGTRIFYSKLAELEQGVWTKHYYAGNVRVASNSQGTKTFYHSDHLGSTRLLTNAYGQKVQDYDYAAFGKTARSAGTVANAKLYGGHESDLDAGLVYMHARYYDPSLGRFLSADSMVPELGNPQAFNRYAYVYNNPIANADPTGHVPVVAAIAVCASVGATVGVASTAFAIAVVGAATMTVGYFTESPLLMSIGGVLLGAASGFAFGAGFLGQAGTLQAAMVSGGVSLMTSPISPLDPKLKQIIGYAYMAQSFIHDYMKMDETVDKYSKEYAKDHPISADKASELRSAASNMSAEQRALASDSTKWTTPQRLYGKAMENMTGGALTQGEAIALSTTGGLIGPDAGLFTALLEVTTGWMPGMRIHAVLHDAGGFLGYYPWAGNWLGTNPAVGTFTGQIEGISKASGASGFSIYSRLFGW